jgi:hypothetical protein
MGTGGRISAGVKLPKREADSSLPSSAEVKNGRTIPALPHVFMAQEQIYLTFHLIHRQVRPVGIDSPAEKHCFSLQDTTRIECFNGLKRPHLPTKYLCVSYDSHKKEELFLQAALTHCFLQWRCCMKFDLFPLLWVLVSFLPVFYSLSLIFACYIFCEYKLNFEIVFRWTSCFK